MISTTGFSRSAFIVTDSVPRFPQIGYGFGVFNAVKKSVESSFGISYNDLKTA
jgi:hypothetical protein